LRTVDPYEAERFMKGESAEIALGVTDDSIHRSAADTATAAGRRDIEMTRTLLARPGK